MKIAITGMHGIMSYSIGNRMLKEGHIVSFIGEPFNDSFYPLENAKYYHIPCSDYKCREIFSSMNFDIVIFIYSKIEWVLPEDNYKVPNLLPELEAVLKNMSLLKTKRFIYLSSDDTRLSISEENDNQNKNVESLNILLGEEYCHTYGRNEQVLYTIVRVSSVYDSEHIDNTFLNGFCRCVQNKKRVYFNEHPNTKRDFVHANDAADAVSRIIEFETDGIVYVLSGQAFAISEIYEYLSHIIGDVALEYADVIEPKPYKTLEFDKDVLRTKLNWAPVYIVTRELTKLYFNLDKYKKVKLPFYRVFVNKLLDIYKNFKSIIDVTVLLGLCEFIFYYANVFKLPESFDIRLVVVVISGILYGLSLGIYAGVMASMAHIFLWIKDGYSPIELLFNVNYWIPYAVYIVTGTITGYIRNNMDVQINFLKDQNTVLEDKYKFIYSLYSEMKTVKNKMQENVANYRDGFSKIYAVTQSLKDLNPEMIYLSALRILEEYTENRTCSIYSAERSGRYCRLIVRSNDLKDKIPGSICLEDTPYIVAPKGTDIGLFVNRELVSDYPSYCVSIYHENEPLLIIMVWKASFEQYSYYFENLLKTIASLISDSLLKAYNYFEKTQDEVYIDGGFIYTEEAFHELFSIRVNMKDIGANEYQLIKITNPEILAKIGQNGLNFIRTRDVFGIGHDGNTYLLLTQATETIAKNVLMRLNQHDINGVIMEGGQYE